MRKYTRGGPLLYGLILVVLAALAIAGAASADHWAAYTGKADSHELVLGNPDPCPATPGGVSFRVAGSALTEGGTYGPSGGPAVVKISDLNKPVEGTLSWALLDDALHLYDVAAVVMKGGPNAMVYHYDASGSGSDDSDTGITTPIDKNGNVDPRPYGISHVDFCFDPKDGTGVKHLVVTKTANTSWEKVYNWDVEKSVDKSQLNMKQGETGSVEWKVYVTHTGSSARNIVLSGTITVENPNGFDVTGVSVKDQLDNAVVDCAPNTSTDLTVKANDKITCTYSVPLTSIEDGTNGAVAVGSVGGIDVSDSGTADFKFGAPSAEINKTVKAVDGKNTWDDIDETSSFTYTEQFPCSSQGRTNVVDLLGDNPDTAGVETDYKLDTDSASVTVRCSETPPPQLPPPTVKTDEFMDVQVVKDATPQVQLVNGQAEIAYTVRVRNNGPNQAHDVKLVDAAPSGVTFTGITQQPVNGSCSLSGGVLLQCSLGTLGPGVERTIGLSARVTQTGTYVNCATGTGNGKDTNGANNMECASTLVTAPVTPPTTPKPPVTKPKPKPVLNICRVLKVTPKMVKANGDRQIVLAKVTRSRTPVQGVAVRFTGTGLAKVVTTNKQGIARLTLTPSKAGIMLVKIASVKACNSARIGVVGVFEPPVTG